ncbi:nucleotide sugar dehydrogenase [Candidatus Pelagibacter sp.]|nr:nucleotide sugar dehydrogenase [Candidatus Pelagibacter sp.]
MKNYILPCIVGLGYVGLPVFNRLQKKFLTIGFDINKKRVSYLKNKIDTNNEFLSKDLILKNSSIFSSSIKDLKRSNFFIVTVPTPLKKKNIPDLTALFSASRLIAKNLKKGDIVFFESTVYPGTSELLIKSIFEKKTNLKEGKDFWVGYSPERINPGDKVHTINKTAKIIAFDTKSKIINNKIIKIYKSITPKIHITNSIKDAETAKIIENIQRDLNIALMNDIYLFSKKMNLNFKNIMNLASTKWNFLKFDAGLVGGHCLPVDPHYLNYIAKKNNIILQTVLAGRNVNLKMENFIFNEIKKMVKKQKKPKVLLNGITYKKNVADIRNSLPLNIFLKLKKFNKNIDAYDYVCNNDAARKYGIKKKINKNIRYNLIIFLVNHKKNKKIYDYAKKNKIQTFDPFQFYK